MTNGTGMQVNVWRGSDEPPTLYHVWIKDDDSLYLYDKVAGKWKRFLDSTDFTTVIQKLTDDINAMTVNGKKITGNPVLGSEDIKTDSNGNYMSKDDSVQKTMMTFDNLFKTCIIE